MAIIEFVENAGTAEAIYEQIKVETNHLAMIPEVGDSVIYSKLAGTVRKRVFTYSKRPNGTDLHVHIEVEKED